MEQFLPQHIVNAPGSTSEREICMQAFYWGKLSELIPVKGMKVTASAQGTVGLQHSHSKDLRWELRGTLAVMSLQRFLELG